VLDIVLVIHFGVLLEDDELVDGGVALLASVFLKLSQCLLGRRYLFGQLLQATIGFFELRFVQQLLLVGRLDPDYHRLVHGLPPLQRYLSVHLDLLVGADELLGRLCRLEVLHAHLVDL
jgi:hypothetical protein